MRALPALDLTLPAAVPGIEDLREKREEVNRQILRDEEEKAKVQRVRGPLFPPCAV